jgi:hypothetical protein
MMTLQNALKICSPLDIIEFEIETQEIVKKKDLETLVPSSLLVKKAEKFIEVGKMPERNPTYWNATEGKRKEEVHDWEDKLATALALERKFVVNQQELDNNSLVISVVSSISMLLVNCKDLPREQIKEAKCATVFTAFGPISLTL